MLSQSAKPQLGTFRMQTPRGSVWAKLASTTGGAIPAPGVAKVSCEGATTLLAATWVVARLREGEVRPPLIEGRRCNSAAVALVRTGRSAACQKVCVRSERRSKRASRHPKSVFAACAFSHAYRLPYGLAKSPTKNRRGPYAEPSNLFYRQYAEEYTFHSYLAEEASANRSQLVPCSTGKYREIRKFRA